MDKVCVICGSPFQSYQEKAKYCSEGCRMEARKILNRWEYKRRAAEREPAKMTCPYCGKIFAVKKRNQITCGGEKCLRRHRRTLKERREQAEGGRKPKPISSLEEEVAAARELGVSYGGMQIIRDGGVYTDPDYAGLKTEAVADKWISIPQRGVG